MWIVVWGMMWNPQARLITADVAGVRVISAYVPARTLEYRSTTAVVAHPASAFTIKQHALIAGDDVLELVLNGVAANRDELLGYGLSEEILYYKRRWFVVHENAEDVLSRLLTQRRPIKDLTNGDET